MNATPAGRTRAVRAAALAVVLGLAAVPGSARAADPEVLTFGGGIFDFSDSDTAGVVSLEYTDNRHWVWKLQPMTGLMATFDGAFYGYAGLSLDLFFGPNVVLTPSFAPGIYIEGGGKDLGHPIEFRSSVKLAWRFADGSRLGLDLNHLSNAGLDEDNPGANQLMLVYSVPFSRGE